MTFADGLAQLHLALAVGAAVVAAGVVVLGLVDATGVVTADEWEHAYSRERAAWPAAWLREQKFWPFVGRVNNAAGDRNLICACVPIEDYAEV